LVIVWKSFLAHWAIPLASWVLGIFVGATFRWFYPSQKEWKAARAERAIAKIDAEVWKQIRPTGSYAISQDSKMIADALSLDQDAVADSLERLEGQGKVWRHGGTLDHPSPYWSPVLR
jgi:hypothetical protein